MSDAPLSQDDLRAALIERRRDLLAALRRGVEAAWLAQLAGSAAALAALDGEMADA